jgi:hypothetical protein
MTCSGQASENWVGVCSPLGHSIKKAARNSGPKGAMLSNRKDVLRGAPARRYSCLVTAAPSAASPMASYVAGVDSMAE